tara:strand:+ start:125 stop:469 length:345 start_codon:yes stop_codon:yes gene_type:complete
MQTIPVVTSNSISPKFNNYVSNAPKPFGFNLFIKNGTAKQFINALKTKDDLWLNENYMNYDTCIDFLMAKNINKMDWSYFDEWWTKFCNIMDSGGFEPGDSWSESDDNEPMFSS